MATLTLASSWLRAAGRLRAALEQHAWDGEWYRRGYFDDGTPLGSAAMTSAASTPSRSPGA